MSRTDVEKILRDAEELLSSSELSKSVELAIGEHLKAAETLASDKQELAKEVERVRGQLEEKKRRRNNGSGRIPRQDLSAEERRSSEDEPRLPQDRKSSKELEIQRMIPCPKNSVPPQGRLAGIDFGTVRMGIATCDPSQTWVTPFETYTRRNRKLDRQYFSRLVSTESLVGWVLGLPIHCDGQESQKSAQVREFAQWLERTSGLNVALFDERFTTAEARRLLQESGISAQKKKKRLDGLAAHLILTHFLDSRRGTETQDGSLEDRFTPPE